MADSTTTNYGWAYPTVNADADTWGTTLNNAIIAIDAQVHSNAASAQPVNAALTGIAGLAGTASTIPYFASAGTIGALSVGAGLSISSNTIAAAVTSVAGRTGAVALSNTDISGLGSMAAQNLGSSGGLVSSAGAVVVNTGSGIQVTGSNAVAVTSDVMRTTNNLSDVSSSSSARSNLGLGNIATHNVTISSGSPSGGSDGDIWLQYS
jgi:hypothetical protein